MTLSQWWFLVVVTASLVIVGHNNCCAQELNITPPPITSPPPPGVVEFPLSAPSPGRAASPHLPLLSSSPPPTGPLLNINNYYDLSPPTSGSNFDHTVKVILVIAVVVGIIIAIANKWKKDYGTSGETTNPFVGILPSLPPIAMTGLPPRPPPRDEGTWMHIYGGPK